jgi:murein L,D-transpeptidase YafK
MLCLLAICTRALSFCNNSSTNFVLNVEVYLVRFLLNKKIGVKKMSKKRTKYTSTFKTKLVLELLQNESTLVQIASKNCCLNLLGFYMPKKALKRDNR